MVLNAKKDQKINLGFFYHRLYNGGIERFITNLANNLIKTNLYNIFIFTGNRNLDDFKIDKRIKRIQVFDVSQLNKEILLSFLRTNRIDIILYNVYWNQRDIKAIIEIGNYLNIKVVIQIHTFFMHYQNANKLNKLYEYFRNGGS